MDRPNPTASACDSVDGRLISEDDSDRFRHLLDHIHDAVVEYELVDDEPIVRGVNPSFVSVFGYEPSEIRGESLTGYVVPSWHTGAVERLECRPGSEPVTYRMVRRETADGLREFLFRARPYETDERVRGFAIYTDLTDTYRKSRQLEVINRVFRHNLRNELNVVIGTVDRLEERVDADEEAQELLSSMQEGTKNLERMTAESTAVYHVRNERIDADASVDCARLLRSVADRFGKRHPGARIDVSVPDSLAVAATDRLASAISSLVENAIEHNPSPQPRVWIDARRVPETEWVEIAVTDDGPEIPEMERQVVTGEAEITQTYHGSGLGLWLVRWTVEKFGGDLSFSTSEAGGNRVQLRLRRP